MSERRPCACRAWIEVPNGERIMETVRRHQLNSQHREWSEMGGMELSEDAERVGREPVPEAPFASLRRVA